MTLVVLAGFGVLYVVLVVLVEFSCFWHFWYPFWCTLVVVHISSKFW